MLQTVEAIVEPSGSVRLLEALHVDQPSRAVVTLLEPASPANSAATPSNTDNILDFLERTRLPAGALLSADEIDTQIVDERNGWDR